MHVAHIVPSLEARHGGPSKSVLAGAEALARLGHEVELLAAGPGTPRNTDHFQLEFFPRNWPEALGISHGLRRRLETSPAEIVHHQSLWLRTLHYAHTCAGRRDAPLVVSPRGMMSEWAWNHHRRRKQIARRFIHPGALEDVAGWHATSQQEADDIKARGFNQPVCVAPNGVSAPTAADTAAAAAYWKEVCPAVTERPVALFYSRFHLKKRVIELIDLWLECAPHDWLLLLVGLPEDYTPATLERYVLRASGGGRVRAFGGANVPPPYAVASLFLLPSHSENFGLVIAEAMAHGVAPVVTDTTPWTSLNDSGGGWCVPWKEFGPALRAATAEPRERLKVRGILAREAVLRDCSSDQSAAKLATFYAELRAKRG